MGRSRRDRTRTWGHTKVGKGLATLVINLASSGRISDVPQPLEAASIVGYKSWRCPP
ncbi:hypothetical protein [Halomicronema sp. CCY15110]|uniref:hypothetical protein n=1 Tax=Halomicronema sp. CCY15110 TaxID=2767773 RepID=UPI0019514093|nr:hypothetical protein [Halomicronema sp. CCY15110]